MGKKADKALEAAKGAAKAARAKGKELLGKGKEIAGKARQALKTSKHRRKIEAGEVVLGAVGAGALEAYDVRLEVGDYQIPAGIPGGVGLVAAGMVLKEPDLEALGVGMVAGGVAMYTNEMIREKMAER